MPVYYFSKTTRRYVLNCLTLYIDEVRLDCQSKLLLMSLATYFRVAVEELLKEAQRGSSRAEVGGALAWKKPPKVNHRLFKNTLAQVVVGNIRKDHSKPSGEPKRKH